MYDYVLMKLPQDVVWHLTVDPLCHSKLYCQE
jgi:hypothetical protein